MSTSEFVQIVIAVIMLLGVGGAYLTALLNSRSSPVLLATKEKHSRDLMEFLESWRNEIYRICSEKVFLYDPLTGQEHQFPIEQDILFADLKNHVPRELDTSELWDKLKLMRNELDTKTRSYYDHIKMHLEQYTKLKVLSYKDESTPSAIGITHVCQDWFYENFLLKAENKAENKDMRLEVRLCIPEHAPNELRRASGDIWAYTNAQTEAQQLMDLIQAMLDNINSGQSDTAEWGLFAGADDVVGARSKLQEVRDMILVRIAEIKAIPILTGNCKHIKRAREPLFGSRRSRREH